MAKIITWLLGIIFIVLGLLFSFGLQEIGKQLGTTYGQEGLVDALAVYAGLHFAIGIFEIICGVYRLYGIGVLLGLLVTLSLGCVRIVSMLMLDTVTSTQIILLTIEILGITITYIAFHTRRKGLKKLIRKSGNTF